MSKTRKTSSPIVVGSIVSCVLLTAFVLLNYFVKGLLDLDVQWLGLAIIPLILALFVGKYIKSFKGFGIELESRLDDPVSTFTFELSKDVIRQIPGSPKESTEYLETLGSVQKASVRRLTFVQGRHNYYDAEVTAFYLMELPGLQFFEVVDADNKFICLLPIEDFWHVREPNYQAIQRFLNILVEGRVIAVYGEIAISDTVSSKASLVEVLPKVRSSSFRISPVVNDRHQLIGIVTDREVEKRISDAVLATYKDKTKND